MLLGFCVQAACAKPWALQGRSADFWAHAAGKPNITLQRSCSHMLWPAVRRPSCTHPPALLLKTLLSAVRKVSSLMPSM